MTAPPRSLLFIPASRPDFVAKAHERGADAIILDLEDGVAAADKTAARAALAGLYGALSARGLPVWVRVNALDMGGMEDLDVVAGLPGAPTVMLPKAELMVQLAKAGERLRAGDGQAHLAPLIETPAGVIHAAEMVETNGDVRALAFGGEDFATALGVQPSEEALTAPAQWVALAAAVRGLPAFGLPGSLSDFSDAERLSRLGRRAANIGFSGALCIHPAQVAILNDCFSPIPEDIAWAGRILAHAFRRGDGASALDGVMVDPPVVARAQRIMARAQKA